MSRKKREWYPGATYHVMSRGNRRTALFKDASDHILFLECIKRAWELYPFKIHALCLMSNHFHMAIETSEVELWRIMKRILHPYSMNFNHKYDFTGHLFESRYVSSLIEDERYFLEVSRYIHLNPVKAKMVRNGAQLIFTSHDLSTMNNEVFRRDEIWFVAKGNNQNSKLYSLVEFKTKNGEVVRKDAKYDKQYLEGKYSADPYLRKIIDWSVVNAQALQRIKEEME